MRCNDCINFKRNKNIDAGKELSACYGTCGMNGSVCKDNDTCKNGFFERN